eukprot:6186494-Pleurochrysis_carterae.AAC.1
MEATAPCVVLDAQLGSFLIRLRATCKEPGGRPHEGRACADSGMSGEVGEGSVQEPYLVRPRIYISPLCSAGGQG